MNVFLGYRLWPIIIIIKDVKYNIKTSNPGLGNSTFLSILPGLNNAGSNISGRLVAAIIKTYFPIKNLYY